MKRLFSYLGAALAVALLLVSPAYAAISGAPAAPTQSSSGLSITPRKNYMVQPGGSVTDKLTIGNLDKSRDLNVSLKLIDFSFTDESGTPKLFLANDAPQTTWSLKPFLTLPKSVVVPGGQSRTVSLTVTMPKGQGAGSYYSAIQYSATGANGGNVSLSASGVTLAFVSVPGVVNEDMTLKKLGAYQSNTNVAGGKFIYIATDKPNQIGFTLKNNGNVAEAPVGSIILKHMFSKKTKVISDVNPTSSLALLGQSRLFLTCIETQDENVTLRGTTTAAKKCKSPSLLPGRYTVTLDAFYGQNGNKTHEILKTAHFWYLPVWFLVAVLIILLLIAYGIWRLKRKLNRATGIQRPSRGRRSFSLRR